MRRARSWPGLALFIVVAVATCLIGYRVATGYWPWLKSPRVIAGEAPVHVRNIVNPRPGSAGTAREETALPPAPTPPTLVIRIEGGDVPATASNILRFLLEQGVLSTAKHTVEDGDVLCDLYRSYTKFPGRCSTELIELARWLNGKRFDPVALQRGMEIVYPVAAFREYGFSMRLAPSVRPQDRDRLSGLRKNWAWLISAESETSEGLLQLRLRGYELTLPVQAERVAELKDALVRISSGNVLADIVTPEPGGRSYQTVHDAREFVTRCSQRNARAGDQGSLIRLLGAEAPASCGTCAGEACAGTVVLIDTPVHRHPDVAAAILDSEGRAPAAAAVPPSDPPTCDLVNPFKKEDHHGTYMAGIIAAGGPKSRLIGVDPDARLYPLPWSNPFTVATRMDELYNQGVRRVFVLATGWTIEQKSRTGRDWRFDKHAVAKFINDNLVRVVAAAGQVPGGEGWEVGPKSEIGPMNLGDLPNVVVVTACDRCDGWDVQLRPDANYSEGATRFVHVAAPGTNIPSTASETGYAVESGTSPAAALVAGLASAMLRCHTSLAELGKLKERLQVTSRPIIGPGAARVAAGVVDANLARLDPTKDYAQLVGQPLGPVMVEHWCQKAIDLLDPENGSAIPNGYITTGNILRLVKVRSDPPQWVAYTRIAKTLGGVLKVGPGTMGPVDVPDNARFKYADKPLLRVKGVGHVSLRQVEDLLVHPAIKLASCG